MQISSFDKWLLTLAMVIIIAGAAFHFAGSGRVAGEQKQKQARLESSQSGSGHFHPHYVPQVPRSTNAQPEPGIGFERLSREKVETWLAKHNRDAMSLLAAFRALDDSNYLNEAVSNFPNDPRVELAVLAHEEFTADRRKWLDLFKASSPSNSLANYLSAQDYFKSGETDAAVQELLAAGAKSQFESFNTQDRLDSEDLYSSSGDSPGKSAALSMRDWAQEDLPELATFKRLAQGIRDAQQQYINSGDSGSAVNLAQMGITLGNQLQNGDSGKYLINWLVGMATKAIVLEQLNPNNTYDFLGNRTPAQAMQDERQQKTGMSQTIPVFDAIRQNLTDQEIAGYYQRTTVYGQIAAMKWVIQQHPAANP